MELTISGKCSPDRRSAPSLIGPRRKGYISVPPLPHPAAASTECADFMPLTPFCVIFIGVRNKSDDDNLVAVRRPMRVNIKRTVLYDPRSAGRKPDFAKPSAFVPQARRRRGTMADKTSRPDFQGATKLRLGPRQSVAVAGLGAPIVRLTI